MSTKFGHAHVSVKLRVKPKSFAHRTQSTSARHVDAVDERHIPISATRTFSNEHVVVRTSIEAARRHGAPEVAVQFAVLRDHGSEQFELIAAQSLQQQSKCLCIAQMNIGIEGEEERRAGVESDVDCMSAGASLV